MTITFKKFAEFVDSDLSDEQINEIFGIFKNNEKVEKLKAEKEALKKKKEAAAAKYKQEREAYKQSQWDSAKKNTESPQKERTGSASSARAAERDWVANMATESTSEVREKALARVKSGQLKSLIVVAGPATASVSTIEKAIPGIKRFVMDEHEDDKAMAVKLIKFLKRSEGSPVLIDVVGGVKIGVNVESILKAAAEGSAFLKSAENNIMAKVSSLVISCRSLKDFSKAVLSRFTVVVQNIKEAVNSQSLEFKEGQEAYADGDSLDHNPYRHPDDKEKKADWTAGWKHAEKKDQD